MKRIVVAWLVLLGVLPLALAGYSAAAEQRVRTFLVDSRIHLSVVARAETGGELFWHDTVTGRSGAVRCQVVGDHLVAETTPGRHTEVHVLPDLAVVLKHPPWGTRGDGLALGVALN